MEQVQIDLIDMSFLCFFHNSFLNFLTTFLAMHVEAKQKLLCLEDKDNRIECFLTRV